MLMLGSRLRTAALVAVMALGVGACSDTLSTFDSVVSTVSGASVPSSVALAARDTFNLAEAAATNYTRLPRCTGTNGPVCRDPSIRAQLSAAVHQGRDARNAVAALQRANPGGAIPIANYNTLTQSAGIINSLTAAYRSATGK